MDEKVLKNLILDTKKTALDNGYIVTLSTSGRSMFPILTSNNTIEIVKCDNKDLRCGDLVVFNPKNSDILIAHRLVYKIKNEKGYVFITKGDSHVHCDNNPVDQDAIIWKITRIKKAKLNISLEHSIGKTINNILFFLSVTRITFLAFRVLRKLKRLLKILAPIKTEIWRFNEKQVSKNTRSCRIAP